MRRRHVFRALLAGSAWSAAAARAQQSGRLTNEAVDELMRWHGLEPGPGEAARVRAFLLSVRPRRSSDPRVEPAFRFVADAESRDGSR